MPGENYSILGCGSCRRTKGLGIFKLPAAKDSEHKTWREAWLSEITKTREKDSYFQSLIDNDRVYTCEKHFKPDEIETCKYPQKHPPQFSCLLLCHVWLSLLLRDSCYIYRCIIVERDFDYSFLYFLSVETGKMTKRKVKFGSLPTENMPKKSHETPKPPSRPHREIVKDGPTTVDIRKYYKGFEDVCKRIKCLKSIREWIVEERNERVVLRKMNECFLLPEFELIIDDSLGYTITVYGWFLPEDHELYTRSLRSVNNVTVSDLIRDIESRPVCPGVSPNELTAQVIPHVIPKIVDPLYCSDDESGFDMFPKKQFWRPSDCSVLCSPQSQLCTACTEYLHASDLKARAKQRRLSEPAHIKAPVASTAPERLKLTLQMQRLKVPITKLFLFSHPNLHIKQ